MASSRSREYPAFRLPPTASSAGRLHSQCSEHAKSITPVAESQIFSCFLFCYFPESMSHSPQHHPLCSSVDGRHLSSGCHFILLTTGEILNAFLPNTIKLLPLNLSNQTYCPSDSAPVRHVRAEAIQTHPGIRCQLAVSSLAVSAALQLLLC